MTIDSTKPLATDLISSIDNYIREDREQINDLWRAIVSANATETDHNMGAGEFYLEIGSDLSDVILELVNLTASVAVNLIQITNGSGGMVKVIRAGDSNITLVHNPSYIHLLAETDVSMVAGDIVVLMNKGGDPDTSVNGVWYELLNAGSGTGQSNTASNVGVGTGTLFKQKTGVDLEFKTLLAGSNISLTNGTSDVTIAATSESNTASNVGTGDGEVFKQKAGIDLEFKTIKAGTNVTVTNNTDDVTITASGIGEANTVSNIGTGDGEVFKQKTAVDFELRTIKAGANVTVTNNATDITISATGGGTGGSNTFASASLGSSDTELIGGTDVSADAVTEVVRLSAASAETLETISGCTAGAVKYIIADGANISVKKSSHMMICQPDANDTFEMSDGDTLGLVNFGGNPGVSNGVWYEVSRSFAV